MKETYRDIFIVCGVATLNITAWITNDWGVDLGITKVLLIVTTSFSILYALTREEQ
jgi:hypothetical protein